MSDQPAIKGVRAGSEWGRSDTERDTHQSRVRRALKRVLPLVDPAGVHYGYMVAGLRGRPAYGPFTEAAQALECALRDQDRQSEVSRETWARRREQS